MFDRLDGFAIRSGVAVTLFGAIPLGLAAAWLASRGEPQLALAANIAVLGSFVVGAGLAAWVQQRRLPIIHGLVTALAGDVVVALTSLAVSLFTAGTWSLLRQALLMTLALGCGLLGGLLGGALRSRDVVPSSDRTRTD